MSKPLLSAGIFNGLIKLSNLFFGVFSTLLLTRALSEITLGVWAQFLLITAVIEILRQSLVRNALITFSKQCTSQEMSKLLGGALVLNIVLAILSSIFLWICYLSGIDIWLRAPGLGEMLLYYIPANLLYVCITFFEWRVVIDNHFNKMFRVVFLRQVISSVFIAAIFFRVIPASTHWLVLGYSLGIGMAALFAMTKIDWKEVMIPKGTVEYKKLLNYGKYSLGTNIALPVFKMTDHVITSMLYSASMVAPLSVCIRLSNIAEIPSQVISEIALPKSATLFASGDRNKMARMYEKAVAFGVVLVCPGVLCCMLFPEFVLWLVAGDKYISYTHLLRVCMLVCLFMPFQRQFGTITDASNSPHINMRMMFVLAAINIPICWYFVQAFGVLGAAYGVLMAHACIFVFNYFVLRARYGISISRIVEMIPQAIMELWKLVLNKWPFTRSVMT